MPLPDASESPAKLIASSPRLRGSHRSDLAELFFIANKILDADDRPF
jgi:hypothetical protein